jgi:hypothetical protein
VAWGTTSFFGPGGILSETRKNRLVPFQEKFDAAAVSRKVVLGFFWEGIATPVHPTRRRRA